MCECRGCASLALKSLGGVGTSEKFFSNDFDGDSSIQRTVDGFVDRSHTALTSTPLHSIPPCNRSRKVHRCQLHSFVTTGRRAHVIASTTLRAFIEQILTRHCSHSRDE